MRELLPISVLNLSKQLPLILRRSLPKGHIDGLLVFEKENFIIADLFDLDGVLEYLLVFLETADGDGVVGEVRDDVDVIAGGLEEVLDFVEVGGGDLEPVVIVVVGELLEEGRVVEVLFENVGILELEYVNG